MARPNHLNEITTAAKGGIGDTIKERDIGDGLHRTDSLFGAHCEQAADERGRKEGKLFEEEGIESFES